MTLRNWEDARNWIILTRELVLEEAMNCMMTMMVMTYNYDYDDNNDDDDRTVENEVK